MDYPPNSKRLQEEEPVEKEKLEQVASATRRKKPLGKRFRETFISGDAKMAMNYVFFSVLMPAAKDMLVEAGSQGIEKLIYGDTKRRSGPVAGSMGHIAYNRMAQGGRPAVGGRQLSRRARTTHDFDEIVLATRTEAEEVIDRLFDLVSRYESASVADLYELTGLESTHTDHKWGWTDIRGATIARVRNGGYLLDLPQPEPLRD